MTWWLRQLCTPLNYLRIRIHAEGKPRKGKFVYDVTIPIIIGIVTTIFFVVFRDKISITGDNGMFTDVKNLLQLLIAFFIAALAAVSTFQNERMELNLSGRPALLRAWSVDERKFKDFELSRRQFVCYLFGYLSFLSIFIFIALSISQGFSSELSSLLFFLEQAWKCSYLIQITRVITVFFFSVIIGNLLTTTLLGLHFLTAGFHKLE